MLSSFWQTSLAFLSGGSIDGLPPGRPIDATSSHCLDGDGFIINISAIINISGEKRCTLSLFPNCFVKIVIF